MQTIEHSAEHSAYLSWLASGIDGKSEHIKIAARTADAASHAELKALARMPCNRECADCTAVRPGWATLPHGALICIDCAQLHRGLGRHLSQVKAFNTGTYLWFPAELALMRVRGNAKSNALFCGPGSGAPPKPRADAPAEEKAAYVRDKYESRRWLSPPPPAAPLAAPSAATAPVATAPPRQPYSLLNEPRAMAVDLLSSPVETLHVANMANAGLWGFAPEQATTNVAPPVVAKVDSFASKKSAVLAAFSASSCGMRAAQCARVPGSKAGAASGSEPFFAAFGL
jgi:hypothetical protein